MEQGVWTRAYLTKFRPDAIGRYHSTKPNNDGTCGPVWMVMERYDGMEFDGRVIRDERTSLVLADPECRGSG